MGTEAPMGRMAIACLLGFGLSVFVKAQQAQVPTSGADRDPAVEIAQARDPVLMQRPAAGLTTPENPEGRIRLDVLVTDAAGKPVSGLTEKDFTLLDNNLPQKVISFRAFNSASAKPDPPVQVILLFDTVNNGFTELAYIREGVEKFLKQNGGHLAQPVSLAALTAKGVNLQTRPSTDGNALIQTLNQLTASVRPRGLDPAPLSILALDRIAKGEMDKPGRKLLVWLGTGWPMYVAQRQDIATTPAAERDQRSQFADIVLLSTDLRESRITLYGGYQNAAFYDRDFLKGVKKVTEVDPRNLKLDVLAVQTGGRGELPTVNRDSNLINQLNSYISDSAAFYTITFDPPLTQQPDEYHDLKVVIGKPRLTAHTNTGYYDEPDYSRRPEPRLTRNETHPDTMMDLDLPIGKALTVAQLEKLLRELHGKPDAEIAKELSCLELTERLTSTDLVILSAGLSGEKAKAALLAVGDASAFLEPPEAEIPKRDVPDPREQRRMVSQAVDYLKKIIPKLPDFYAKRFTTSFEMMTTPKDERAVRKGGALHPAGEFRATVYYRGGKEVSHPEGAAEFGLITQGVFGPILSTVIVDAAHSSTQWSRWEEGPSGPMAVFRFQVPSRESHYEVSAGILGFGEVGAMGPTAYHGEIGIDPNSGAILRLVLEADPDLGSSITRADIMVEYGSVVIGEKTYTCPIRSVSISTGKSPQVGTAMGSVRMREVTRLDDVVFSGYHVFRSDFRILPD